MGSPALKEIYVASKPFQEAEAMACQESLELALYAFHEILYTAEREWLLLNSSDKL